MSESNPKHTRNDLFQMQSLPLDMKVKMTERRIREWYEYYGGEVAVSFSGGKDSAVLLHICRGIYPDMKAVYFNTGLEFPSLTRYVKEKYENVEICKPKYTFVYLVKKYGYPLISKEISQHLHDARGYIEKRRKELVEKSFAIGGGTRNSDLCYVAAVKGQTCSRFIGVYNDSLNGKENPLIKTNSLSNSTKWLFMLDSPFYCHSKCCMYLKKNPSHEYSRRTGIKFITAQMASESLLRTQHWLLNGCNAYDKTNPISNPMSFWTEQDVLAYAYLHGIELAPPYGKIIKEGKGDKPFEQLELFDIDAPVFNTEKAKRTGCFACGFGAHLEKDSRLKMMLDIGEERLVDWILRGGAFEEETGLWKPKGGLGMFFCYEWMNRAGGLNIWLPDKEKYYSKLPDEAKRILDNQGLWQWNPNLWEDFQRRQNTVKGGDSNGSRSIQDVREGS